MPSRAGQVGTYRPSRIGPARLFVPPYRPEQMPGSWQRYLERWREMALERIDPRLVEVLPKGQEAHLKRRAWAGINSSGDAAPNPTESTNDKQ
jgi:hypothetical protein